MKTIAQHFWFATCVLIVATMLFTGCGNEQAKYDEGEATTEEAPPTETSPVEMASADDIAVGQGLFNEHCASCHGENSNGEGDPEMLALLEKPPPDMRLLNARHNGEFPVQLVMDTIDGREQFQSHGTRDMPFWGEVWYQKEGEQAVNPKIEKLIAFMKSIQVEEDQAETESS